MFDICFMSNIIYQLLKQFYFLIFNIYYLLFVFQYSISLPEKRQFILFPKCLAVSHFLK